MTKLYRDHIILFSRYYAETVKELIAKGILTIEDDIIDELKTSLIDKMVLLSNLSPSEIGAIIDKEFDNVIE